MSVASPDLPEPEWWQYARDLEKKGLRRSVIARSIGVSYSSVRYALDPEYRERTKSAILRWQKANPVAEPVWRNVERNEARRRVRTKWRREGRVGSLHDLYVEAGCGPLGAQRSCPRSNRPKG